MGQAVSPDHASWLSFDQVPLRSVTLVSAGISSGSGADVSEPASTVCQVRSHASLEESG